ncbi:MAG: hypothetical protein GWM98_04850 [Nitrospinaceae bacterium]|nr:hypothetical protein [Deltaproteobacteria bacterium]NIY14249.1 hypothetical protein [Nitrospinaceae bacterium]
MKAERSCRKIGNCLLGLEGREVCEVECDFYEWDGITDPATQQKMKKGKRPDAILREIKDRKKAKKKKKPKKEKK